MLQSSVSGTERLRVFALQRSLESQSRLSCQELGKEVADKQGQNAMLPLASLRDACPRIQSLDINHAVFFSFRSQFVRSLVSIASCPASRKHLKAKVRMVVDECRLGSSWVRQATPPS